jgi:hypothetical protein
MQGFEKEFLQAFDSATFEAAICDFEISKREGCAEVFFYQSYPLDGLSSTSRRNILLERVKRGTNIEEKNNAQGHLILITPA